MRWAEKKRAWEWRVVRLIHAAAGAALAGDQEAIHPGRVLDAICDMNTYTHVCPPRESEMNRLLAAWEAQYLNREG
jgi:hypothetical protein